MSEIGATTLSTNGAAAPLTATDHAANIRKYSSTYAAAASDLQAAIATAEAAGVHVEHSFGTALTTAATGISRIWHTIIADL